MQLDGMHANHHGLPGKRTDRGQIANIAGASAPQILHTFTHEVPQCFSTIEVDSG
jgi:hypothetical protein